MAFLSRESEVLLCMFISMGKVWFLAFLSCICSSLIICPATLLSEALNPPVEE